MITYGRRDACHCTRMVKGNKKAQIRTTKIKHFRARIRGRSAQIRMTETVAILFIFFVLVLFGIIFYYKFQQISLQDKQEELLAARAMDTTLRVLFLPELSCTNGDTEPEDNCIDLAKLKHAKSIFTEKLNAYYFDIFSYARITVYQTFPDPQETYELYLKEKPAVDEEGNPIPIDTETTYFVVTLKDELSGIPGETHYGYGYVKVEVVSRFLEKRRWK